MTSPLCGLAISCLLTQVCIMIIVTGTQTNEHVSIFNLLLQWSLIYSDLTDDTDVLVIWVSTLIVNGVLSLESKHILSQ